MYYNEMPLEEHGIADDLIKKAWGEQGENIKSWYVRSFNDLRFILRDGKKILQAHYFVHVTFKERIFKWDFGWGGYRTEEEKYVWLDIPLDSE